MSPVIRFGHLPDPGRSLASGIVQLAPRPIPDVTTDPGGVSSSNVSRSLRGRVRIVLGARQERLEFSRLDKPFVVDIADDVGVFDPRAEVSGALSVDGNHSLEQLAKVVLCRCVSDPETETCVIPGLDVGGAKRGPTDFSLIGG